MNTLVRRNGWLRMTLAIVIASLLIISVYAALAATSAAGVADYPDREGRGTPPKAVASTVTYTHFLPIVFRNGCPGLSRPRLEGMANFSGVVSILAPQHCTTGFLAETPIAVNGTYTNTPNNTFVWVLVYASNQLYYPQSPNACTGEVAYQAAGQWQVPIYLGESGGSPEQFEVVVILADPAASQFLSDHLKEGCLNGYYEGIPAADLEQMNITEKRYVSVQTVD